MVVTLLSNRLQTKATHCAVPVGFGAVVSVECRSEAMALPLYSWASTLLSSFLMIPSHLNTSFS